MEDYETEIRVQLEQWQEKMTREPSATGQLAKNLQDKMNKLIPEKAHRVITAAIKQMVSAVLVGSEYTSGEPLEGVSLEEREGQVRMRIETYKKMGAASGAITGAGGLLMGLADFPVLLGLKMKLLFEIAGLYGFNVTNYPERVYILHIFQLAFSSPEKRKETYGLILQWETGMSTKLSDPNEFDWRTFQQEYRDYIDLAKMLQLVPGIGAFVGAVANHKLVDKLGETAMNAYRLRLLSPRQLSQ